VYVDFHSTAGACFVLAQGSTATLRQRIGYEKQKIYKKTDLKKGKALIINNYISVSLLNNWG